MSKKMHDILPPKLARKVEDTVRSLDFNGKKSVRKPAIKKPAPVAAAKKPARVKAGFPLKELVVGVLVIAFLLGAYGVTKLPKAHVQIWPKLETITLSEKITADKSAVAADPLQNRIPLRVVEVQKEGTQSFEATGSASNDGQAKGVIKVYNKTDSLTAFTLIKGTHFLSDSGKYFVTLERLVIPAAKKVGGKITPGSANVNVQAEESGEAYNIGPSKFSVPKLNGTAYYYTIYGESTAAMTGGRTGSVKKVTNSDIETAKEILTKKLLEDAQNALRGGLTPDDILLDGALEGATIDATCDVKSGAVVNTFTTSAKVKVSALVFKKSDLEVLMKNAMAQDLPNGKEILGESVKLEYQSDVVSMQQGQISLDVQSSASTYHGINAIELVDLFATKSADQIKEIIDQRYSGEISELKVDFWPFWVHRAPKNHDQIKVEVMFK